MNSMTKVILRFSKILLMFIEFSKVTSYICLSKCYTFDVTQRHVNFKRLLSIYYYLGKGKPRRRYNQ